MGWQKEPRSPTQQMLLDLVNATREAETLKGQALAAPNKKVAGKRWAEHFKIKNKALAIEAQVLDLIKKLEKV